MDYKIADFDWGVRKRQLTQKAEFWSQVREKLPNRSDEYKLARSVTAIYELSAQGIRDENDALALLHSARVTEDTAGLLGLAVRSRFPIGEDWEKFEQGIGQKFYPDAESGVVKQVVDLCAPDSEMRLGLSRFAEKHYEQVRGLEKRTNQRLFEIDKLYLINLPCAQPKRGTGTL